MGRTEQQHFLSGLAGKQEGWELSWGCQLCQHPGKPSILPCLCLCQPGVCSSLSSSAQDLLHGFFKSLRSCTEAQACCQHGHLKPAYPRRRWASMSLTQEVPPGMSPRRWTQGSSTPPAPLGPIPMPRHNNSAAHPTQHLQKQTTPSPLIFQRETGHIPQALLGGAAGIGVPCGRDHEEMLPFQGTRRARDRSYCR